MIKKCTFADKYQGIRPPKCGPDKRGCKTCWKKWDEMHPLSEKFKKELVNTMKDIKDPHRYVIVSSLLDTFNLFYCVESNCYAGSFKKKVIPGSDHCTAFKSIKIAKAVRSSLHEGKKRNNDLEIWKVVKNKTKLKFVEKSDHTAIEKP